MIKILGISAFYHDSAAALIIGDKIVAAAQEERFTRLKNTSEFPVQSIKYCLSEGDIELDELDAIVFYDKPFLKFERIIETYYSFAPKGLISFLTSMPIWLREKLFLKKLILNKLSEVGEFNKSQVKLLFPEHHLSHASSAFFPSKYESAAILTIDGVGEWCTTSIGYGESNRIELFKQMLFPHSVGLLYSSFTYFLGFRVNSGEYKLMGLAPYGNPEASETKTFIKIIKSELIDIKEDGSIWLNQSYFHYSTGLKMINDKKWEKLFGFARRDEQSKLCKHHANLALAIQKITEEIVIKMAKETKRLTRSENLCLAGGVALNSVINGILVNSNIFKRIFVQPASGDAGGALGAALAAKYMYFLQDRQIKTREDELNGSYLGPQFSPQEIEEASVKMNIPFIKYEKYSDLVEFVVSKLETGNVIGWFQGRMEFGPRALGNRSILGDPRKPELQMKLNLKVKKRESFRPFAPAVLLEKTSEYFNILIASPYMTYVVPLKKERRKELPEDYLNREIEEMMKFDKSDFPSITHVDFSARVQTVDKHLNTRFRELIHAFEKKTGCALLINTSMNVRGEPIACDPSDAIKCFLDTEMDYLVIGDYLYCKK